MGQSAHDSHYEEFKKFQSAQTESRAQVNAAFHPTPEFKAEVPAGGREKAVSIHAFEGAVYISTHGEAKFDKDSLQTLRQALAAAYQAVA